MDEMIYWLLFAVNVIVFVLSVIKLKGVEYIDCTIEDYKTKISLIRTKEWQKIKLPILFWLAWLCVNIVPLLGCIISMLVCEMYVSDIQSKHPTYETALYRKLIKVDTQIMNIVKWSYKWLLIKV